jgi:hypothetical protein
MARLGPRSSGCERGNGSCGGSPDAQQDWTPWVAEWWLGANGSMDASMDPKIAGNQAKLSLFATTITRLPY